VAGRDAEEVARRQRDFAAVAHLHCRASRKNESDMLNLAELGRRHRAKMLGPAPPGLVQRPSNLEIADAEALESAERKRRHPGGICEI
jgi:hypothetical protein